MASLRSSNWVLQEQIGITDKQWSYQVPNLPSPDKRNQSRLVQSIAFVSSAKEQHVKLRLETAPSNRVTWSEPLDHFLLLSFNNFRLREPAPHGDGQVSLAPARDSAEYIARLLKDGIRINGKHYNFFGHSNSQLKSRSCFMFAASKDEISAKVQSMGDFSKIKTVAKLAKRIGLLFSSAEMATTLQPDRCEDIDDITIGDYCFTDGCGLMSRDLARLVVQRKNIVFRNKRYHPCVFQIRYRGYKGVLTVDPSMKGKTLAKFRQSMKKFNAHGDLSLSVVEYSKPYTFGFLNDEIVLLLSALGVSAQHILQKQQEYLAFLDTVFEGQPIAAFQFLSFIDNIELAERLLMEGIEPVRSSLRAAVRQEQSKMLNKYEEQRCRIMVRQSRLLFGICDPTGTPSKAGLLKPGTCFVRVTLDGIGEPRTLVNTEVLVTRNPCLHPGDLQKFRAVDVPELAHICDAIIFPTTGQRPSADLMSGGDLDGDKFFVTWDPDIIPSAISQPAAYPGVRERITLQAITDDDRVDFFAKYTNASLGRVKNLYLKWARLKGPMSAECQQMNRLFSQCVDGNRIRVPQNLEDPPEPSTETPPFILDIVHEAATDHIRAVTDGRIGVADLTDMTELIATREDFVLSEFELIQLVMRKCGQDGLQFAEYAPMFNYQALTDEQQAWLIARLPPIKGIPSLVRNGLMQSELVVPAELKPFRLDDPRLHWKSVFRSSDDRLGRFLHAASQSLELFHKKLIILQADERLTLMIYIPHKIPRASEAEVGDSVRIFALPHSSGLGSPKYHVTPSKSTSRLYCDGNTFQLYEVHRRNTFVFLTRGPQDQGSYQQLTSAGDRRRQKQQTLDDGSNFDNRASVALNKISGPIASHVGRMNRSGIIAAEIYVISNRDVESMRLLDQWLHYVDTQEVLPLFEPPNTEYRAPTLESLERDSIPQNVANVVWDHNLNSLGSMTSVAEIRQTLQLLASINQSTQLRAVCAELINIGTNAAGPLDGTVISRAILRFLSAAPYLTELYLGSQLWQDTKASLAEEAETSLLGLLKELVLSTNRMQAFVRAPFLIVLREMKQLSIQSLAEIIELVAVTVEQPEFALDLLLQCLEPETSRLLLSSPLESQQLIKSLTGIALDHIDEASSGRVAANQTFSMSRDGSNEGFEVLKAITRIDAPGGHAKIGDHVRLIATSPPQNAPLERPYAMDALVIGSEQGAARFRCIHHVPAYVADCTWKLRQCGSFVTAKAMFDAVTALYGTKAASCGIYKQLIGLQSDRNQPDPTTDEGTADQPDLNGSQNRALKAVSAHSLTLLWGPPGTGKTYTVVRILKLLLATHPEDRFLVTAPTHNAVDNLMQRFIEEDRTSVVKGDPIRVSTDLQKVNSALRKWTCDAMVGKDLSAGFAGRSQAQKRVRESRLIFTTCAGAALGLLRTEGFGVVIVDEASQITEPGTLIPLTKGCRRAVLVGDHVQLRATVQRHAVLAGYDISLFERLYGLPARQDTAKVMLDTQYRMHPDICAFSSKAFYESKLCTAPGLQNISIPQSQFPWLPHVRKVFIQCDETEDIGRQSKSNKGQVQLCKTVCDLLRKSAQTDQKPREHSEAEIAILTPYTRQRESLQTALPGFSISSIDGFQGREADIVIFVTVRSNAHHDIGFLSDLRRLNVVMTRAKAGVIIIGHRETLLQEKNEGADEEAKKVWKELLRSCETVKIENEA